MKAHASKIGKAMCAALFVLLLNVVGMTKANPVDMSTAREVAMKFMNANTNAPLRSIDDLHHVTTYNISRGDAAFYIFNTPNGFVIVSADDCATPILGYSNEGQFDTENIPIQLQDYLQGFVNQIQYGIENQIEADERTARQWEMVRTIGRLTNNRTDEVVEPLLTTKWGQRYPYNMFVPSDCPTGCVATAMAQIMKYWEWPVQGVGEHSYLWNGQILSANFGETTYDWDNMLDDYDNNPGTQEQKEAVATLMWHCGVSVNMDYSPNGSGAGLNSGTLIDYFSYSDEMSLEYSWDYSTASWNARLKDCLNLGRPLYYMGHQYSGSGHAFVCDGYDINDMFHFNWGWDGGFDGYFSIGVLYVNTLNYNYENLAIFNIHPQGEATNYTINISVNNDEGGSASGGGSFAHGDHVTLTAIANDGYGFCYWEENGGIASTNPNYSFTANYNRDLVAKFAEPFVVTVMAEEGGTVSGGGSFLYGQSCSVSATANEGYGFANWTKNGVVASIDANYTFAVTDESLLIAHFVPLEGNIEFADDNVKAICLTNWDTNEDGELSYVEAAAVTSLGEVFRGNMEIISFDELQYFISLTSIGDYAFNGCGELTSMIIPDNVISIGNSAFNGCSGMTGSLTIPNSVTSIGYRAFRGCSGFTGSLTIPSSVTSIGSYAFYGCSGFTGVNYTGDIAQWCNIQFANYASNPLIYAHNLYIDNELVTELVIPETIMEIKDYVFHGATCLTSLTIPNSVTSIGSYAFGSCSGLTGSLIIPNTVTSIGSSAFSNCSGFTGSLTIPSTVASIGSSAFNNCSGFTGDLIIPNSVTSIGSNAFRGCSGFTGSLTIPNSVTLIGSYAFYNCRGFTGSLTIPNSVTSLDGSAFYNCYGLSSMVVLAEMPPAVGSDAFYNISTNIPVYVPCESLETYQTAEGWNAFTNIMCISSGTISVVADPFEGGEVSGAGTYEGGTFCTVTATPNEGYVFANWTKNGIIVSNSPSYSFVVTGESVLNARFVAGGNIDFADANVKAICVANWDTDGDGELSYVEAASVTSLVGVFSGNTEITSFEELQYFISLSTIGADFYNCSGLTGSLYIPNSVTSIGNSAFRGCSGLTGSLTLPNTLTTIGIFAFEGCSGLTGNLIIPNSVTSIGDCAFYNCSGLNGNLTISNSLTSIGSYVFYGCSGLTGSLNIPNSVTSIGNSAFRGCSGLTGDLIIPNSVTSIGDCAFYGCSGLNGNLTIFNSLTSIGSSVFYSCSGLTGNLIIPNSVTSIGDCAFYNCSGLNGNLTISNSLTSIGSSAFSNCSGFTGDLIIPNSVTSIGGYAFYGCSGLNGNLTISNSLTSIGSSVFDGCSGLTGSLNIPNSVTSIGNSAFRGCSGLTGDLIIPNSVTSIGSSAFWRCSGLTGELIIPNSVTSIGSFAFYYCRSLASVIMLSSTVPSLGNNAFSGTNANYYIYVPYPSLEAYKTATNWSNYEHRIFPMAYASVSGYGTGNGRWVFIASPFSDDVVPSAIDNMLLGTNYDLYQFDQSATDEEWQNYKDDSFNLVNGHGYMYANGVDVNVIFKGAFNEDETKVVSLDYDAEKTNPGWNLVGNPFPVDAYIDRPYYVMNEDGTAINPIAVPADTPIPPCVGVLVKANGTGESVTFSRSAPETRK